MWSLDIITLIMVFCDTKKFLSSIKTFNQTISFCGVNVYYQNDKAERCICDVTTGTRLSLIYASHHCTTAIDAPLWTLAMKNYINLRNKIPKSYNQGSKVGRKKLSDTFTSSPLSLFSGSETTADFKKFHSFRPHVYILEPKLQDCQSHKNWSDGSRVGILLCHSTVLYQCSPHPKYSHRQYVSSISLSLWRWICHLQNWHKVQLCVANQS